MDSKVAKPTEIRVGDYVFLTHPGLGTMTVKYGKPYRVTQVFPNGVAIMNDLQKEDTYAFAEVSLKHPKDLQAYVEKLNKKVPEDSPLDTQIGGGHYKALKIQPIEYCMANGLDACQSNIVKYVTRFREKGGIEDLEKIKHYVDLLISFEKEKT